jgi:predicted membrane GTPase involved in stress response
LIGMRTRMLTATGGEAIFSHRFNEYRALGGDIPPRLRGALISTDPGAVTSYALDNLNDRGDFFVEPGDAIYVGQVVGENCREGDLGVNVCRSKHLTNIRSSTKEAFTKLKTKRAMSLEETMERPSTATNCSAAPRRASAARIGPSPLALTIASATSRSAASASSAGTPASQWVCAAPACS